MSYEAIPQEIKDIINTQYPQINDEHKKQLVELWRILLQNGDEEEATPQFVAFLQMRIFNQNNPLTISDIIDAEIARVEGLTGGKKKRKRVSKKSKKSFRKSSKKSFRKSYKKSYKKRK
uniref:Uncharacterized protein n=1 Tax=viral metagenome TaxID=1070528 RepID=A0A6C0IF64_9ZZZZ